jgi:hypothetical protein
MKDSLRKWWSNKSIIVYYESRKQNVIRKEELSECDEKPKTKVEKSQTVVYYESRKRQLKIRLMNKGRSDERLKTRVEEST